ncbi:CAP domain-containing protein [Flavobacterium sp. Fl-318]|uniref:CAP domain-containing protein n=1 Tax=Flavobacterium cupriresistens TaxID=2893885 RepID=A0ABU4RHQ3_9FLAO|nr:MULTISPECIES: CAP domain-containing protein [unclassified Flavobacterium]MDX6192098.1 CAP domain-containing protein [Flavobacterium sp. Fl-318]UFH41879.1 CAP domain-containing protein [Flavobacterium sp. F-323]
MKKIFYGMMFVVILITMSSCSADTADGKADDATTAEALTSNYTYNPSELELIQRINDYRVSVGLNALERINFISNKCEQHNEYMIANNVADHNDFMSRSESIMKALSAKKVGENVARNYKTSEAALKAWLDSPGHKKNIEGDFTHFGISVSTDSATGYKYYTNIFAKI